MKLSTMIRIVAAVMTLALAGCASQGMHKSLGAQNPGFLQDYSRLQWDKDQQGNPVRTWISPELTPGRYDAILLEPLQLYPKPEPTAQVSRRELQRIQAYANQALRRELAKRFVLVNAPRADAVRVRAAISGVAAKGEGLAPYQYVPIAFVATMAKRAVAGTPQRAFIVSESELRDSVTGALVAQRVKVGSGSGAKLQKISGTEQVTLETVRPLIDELAAAALPNLEQVVRAKPR